MPLPDAPAPYQLTLSQGLPDDAGAARLRRDLPEDEWRWITRLRRPDDRLRSLVGRALTRRLLGRRLGLAPAAVPLGAGPRGKPVLLGPAWHFNIAHSGDLVLVGIGPGPLGVDVEHCLDRADPDLWRLVTGGPPPAPAPGRSGTAPDPHALCAQWVRREAALKACGLGLTAEPGALRLADADEAGWAPVSGLPGTLGLWVRLLWTDPDHCAALCLPGAAPPAWALQRQPLPDWLDAPG